MNTIGSFIPEKAEILQRIGKLHSEILKNNNDWDAVFIVDKVNQYYLTGTMQDGVFVLQKDGSFAYFVRRSYERANYEALIDNVYPMVSYKDIFEKISGNVRNIYIESEIFTYGMLKRLEKYFNVKKIFPVDKIIARVRSVKSPFELSCMEESGRQQKRLLEEIVPGIFKEGMSESDFCAILYENMIKLGYHGVTRFSMFQTEVVMGQMGFAENSLYPTSFDGPGGMKGSHPAAAMTGDRQKFLKKGDLVFVDIGYGVCGYHTDRTQVYMFGKTPSEEIAAVHKECVKIQSKIASMLKPGNIPDEIYNKVMDGLDNEFSHGFMNGVKFLGHGVGLYIDESPVITRGWMEPLIENMVLAVEPKKSMKGIGTLGVEDTYIVTPNGGKCITGGEKEIMVVSKN